MRRRIATQATGEEPFWLLPIYEQGNNSETVRKRISAALIETGFKQVKSYNDDGGFPTEDWQKGLFKAKAIFPRPNRNFLGYQSPVRPEMYFEVNAVIRVQGDEHEGELANILSDIGGGQHGDPI